MLLLLTVACHDTDDDDDWNARKETQLNGMNKYVKKLIETYANTFAFNPAVLSKGPTKKVS